MRRREAKDQALNIELLSQLASTLPVVGTFEVTCHAVKNSLHVVFDEVYVFSAFKVGLFVPIWQRIKGSHRSSLRLNYLVVQLQLLARNFLFFLICCIFLPLIFDPIS